MALPRLSGVIRRMLLSKTFYPFKLRFFKSRRSESFTLLDIGCGNQSPEITKHWFPKCHYIGIDNTPHDKSLMDEFYELDLEKNGLERIPDNSLDVVIFAHVIEHLTNGRDVLVEACRKLKSSGEIYVETPSEKSLTFPEFTAMNFRDDPTHVRIYPISEMSDILRCCGCEIVHAGLRRDPVRLAVSPITLIVQSIPCLIRRGKIHGPAIWDWVGFAAYVHGRKLNERRAS